MEISRTTELECFKCGKKIKTNPNSNKMPKGWTRKGENFREEGFLRSEIKCFCEDCKGA